MQRAGRRPARNVLFSNQAREENAKDTERQRVLLGAGHRGRAVWGLFEMFALRGLFGPGCCVGVAWVEYEMKRELIINDFSLESYMQFLEAKKQPMHRVEGRKITIEEVHGFDAERELSLSGHLFDYQKFIVTLSLARKRFAVFADVGLGKTAIFLEWVRHIQDRIAPKKVLIISQLHLIRQTIDEQVKFYGKSEIIDINAIHKGSIEEFLKWHGRIGIVNLDKFKTPQNINYQVGAVVLDESSCLKNGTGKIRTSIIESCKGIQYKLACSATPAPNDRQEYANHALFLDYIDNFKQFFTKYFYNTGSGNDFELKPHAKMDFYKFLSTWSIFLKNPSKYGFNDNLHDLQPAEVIWDRIELTQAQHEAALTHASHGQMSMFGNNAGGITNRNKISQISKGFIYANQ